jgi:hypothetical protein
MKDQKNREKPRYIDYAPMPKEMIFLIGLAVGLFATLVMMSR